MHRWVFGHAWVSGPLAAPQPIEKFLSKPDVGGPNGFFLQGNPPIEVGGFPPASIDGSPGGKRPLGPIKFTKNLET